MKKSLKLILAASVASLFVACGGGSDNQHLPKSPFSETDLSTDFKFKDYQTKEEFDKDFEMISKKCSYAIYWKSGDKGVNKTAVNLSKEERNKKYPNFIETYSKIDSFNNKCNNLVKDLTKKQFIKDWNDIHKVYPEYEAALGKVDYLK